MGPESAQEALKTAIAMGCDSGVMLTDEALDGCDARTTACVLASAIEKLGDVQLAIFGKQAIDGDTGLVPVSVACALGWTPLSYVAEVNELDLQNGRISVARSLEEGRQYCSGALPAVISVVKEINEPRYPSFIGIRKASKAKIPLWGLADLGLDISEISVGKSAVTWADIRALPARGGSVEIIDGDSIEVIVAKLVDRLMTDKVI
jgi:electron transfer flavoprotein beta subunit